MPMICQPCKDGIHLGDASTRIATQVCMGGTWCDCQHRDIRKEHGMEEAKQLR